MTNLPKAVYIATEQLCIGIYVYLDLKWLEHSFPLNHFKIKSEEQIVAIKQLGLKKIRVDPKRSAARPLPLTNALVPNVDSIEVAPTPLTPAENAVIEAKKARVKRLLEMRDTTAKCEKEFLKAANALKSITRNIFSRPKEAFREADELVRQMVAGMLTEKDVAIHLMNDKISGEEVYLHSMNVAVLAMMLAKEMGLSNDEIQLLGVGCLFHDIGKVEIPDRVLQKATALTRAEQNLMQQHCHYGNVIGEKLGLPQPVHDIIMQHHEYMDGSGYPSQLTGSNISALSRLVCIVNTYDNHCNHPNPLDSFSPYEALSYMFTHQRKLFDTEQLSVFIRCLGVYPPGTLVTLSNQMIGMVVSVNSSKPLRPSVVIYDPDVPKSEAIILDLLNESEINVLNSLKAKQLAPEVYEYLSPRKRMTYYFDASEPKTTAQV